MSVSSAAQRPNALRALLALLRGARHNTPMRQLSNYARPFSAQRLKLRFALLYELIREVGSVYRRILELHSRGVDEQGWGMTWLRAVAEPQRCVAIQAHNEDIQNLRTQRPWLTGFDVALYLEGFEAGLMFQPGTLRREAPRKGAACIPPYSDACPNPGQNGSTSTDTCHATASRFSIWRRKLTNIGCTSWRRLYRKLYSFR